MNLLQPRQAIPEPRMDASRLHHTGVTDGGIAVPSVSNSKAATPQTTPDSETDISCSHSAGDHRNDTEQVCSNKSNCETDKASEIEKELMGSSYEQNKNHGQTSEERKDFTVENQLLQDCSGVVVEAQETSDATNESSTLASCSHHAHDACEATVELQTGECTTPSNNEVATAADNECVVSSSSGESATQESAYGLERKRFGDGSEPLQQCSEVAADTQEPFVVTSEPNIEPSCNHHAYDIYKEVEEIPSDDNTDCKTSSDAGAVETECVVSSSSNHHQVNEVEREDQIKSQFMQTCSEMVLEEQETCVPRTEMDPPCMHHDYNIHADSQKVPSDSNTNSGLPNVSKVFAAPGWIRPDPCSCHTFVIYNDPEEDSSDNNTKSGSSTLPLIPETRVDHTYRMYEPTKDTPSDDTKSDATTSSVISESVISPKCSHEMNGGAKEVLDDINSEGNRSPIDDSATCCAEQTDPSDLSAKSETSNYYKLIPESRVVPSWLHFTSDICEEADEVSLSRNANSKTPTKAIKNEYIVFRSEQNTNQEHVNSETTGEAILISEQIERQSTSSASPNLATGSSSLFGHQRYASVPGCSNANAAVKKSRLQKGQKVIATTPRKRDSDKRGDPIVCGKKPSGSKKKFSSGHSKHYLMVDANKFEKCIQRPKYMVVEGTGDNASPVDDNTPLSTSELSKEQSNSEGSSRKTDTGLIPVSRMDTKCCDLCDDMEEIPKLRTLENKKKHKTETATSATEDECLGGPISDKTTNHQQIDEMEREDFEEENRLIKYWTERIATEKGISPSKVLDFSQDNMKPSGSKYPNNLFCKSTQANDSNTTIKNKVNQTKEEVPKDDDSSNNQSDRWSLRISSPIIKTKILFKKVEGRKPIKCFQIPKYNMDDTTVRDSPDVDILACPHDETPSTSKSLENAAFSKDEPSPRSAVIRNFLYEYYSGDADTDDDSFDNISCTCVTSPDEDSEPEINRKDSDDSPRLRRKRPCEATSPVGGTPPKRYLADGPSTSAASADRLATVQGSGGSATSTNQGPPELNQWLHRFNTWSNSERIQAIDALISRSAACQVRHMMNAIEPLFQRDFISLLPKELALSVLGYLEPDDLLRAAQTCRYWRFLADDNLLWRVQCRRIGIKTLKRRTRATPFSDSPWKAVYMRQQMVESNWVKRPVNTPIVMKGHDDHVITCLQFYGKRIVSGSDDTTLKVWSAVTGRCLKTLVGHTGGVWSSQMHGRLVISGSTDRTLRVWNARTGICLKILAGHTSTVRCMHLYKDRVVSGSRDATLRVWSIPEGRCLRVLVGHLAAVRCVQYDGKVVVSGAYDYFVKIWNPDTGECLHTLAGHTNRVYSLQFDGVHVVSGSLDTSIRVWDVESGSLKHTLIGHQSLTSGMELHANILVSGNADSTVKVWDISTGHCLHTLSGPNKHQSAVTCLQSSKRFVMTSSDDGTVKLWDVRTGEFIRNLVELGSGGSGGVVWRIRASDTKLICAVGSRNGTEETKLLVLNFDLPPTCYKCTQ